MTPRNPPIKARTRPAARAALTGSRRHHRQSHSARPIRRATIGRSSRNRRRSSARSSAVAYRLRGSFSRHFRQMVSISRGRWRWRRPGGKTSCSAAWLRVDSGRRALERRAAGEHLVEDRAQGVDVGGGRDVGGRAAGLLGGHVARRAHDVAGAGQARLALHQLGQAEVGDLRDALVGEHDVGRLDVAVDDPVLVGVVEGPGERLDQPRGLARRLRDCPRASAGGCRPRRTPAPGSPDLRTRRPHRPGRYWGDGSAPRPRPRRGTGRRCRGRRRPWRGSP